jgi:hypothetical protein
MREIFEGWGCAREMRGGGGGASIREISEGGSERDEVGGSFSNNFEGEGSLCVAPQFRKMVYEIFFRKPFSKSLHCIFQSNWKYFQLTIFYKQTNIRKY